MKNTKENIIIEKNKYLAAFWLMMALTVLLVALFFNILFNGTFVNTASFVSYIITSIIIFVLSVFSVFIIAENISHKKDKIEAINKEVKKEKEVAKATKKPAAKKTTTKKTTKK